MWKDSKTNQALQVSKLIAEWLEWWYEKLGIGIGLFPKTIPDGNG
jgi:hypothetical protein